MLNHGINTAIKDTSFLALNQSDVGVPFFVGCWPCHAGAGYTGQPQLVRSYDEAVALGGSADDWSKWTLCEAAYTHFVKFGMAPAIFVNVYDPATHCDTTATTATKSVVDHKIVLPIDTLSDGLVVKSGDDALVINTDYTVEYVDNALEIRLVKTSEYYSAESLTVIAKSADLTKITNDEIIAEFAKIDRCMPLLGTLPNLICAPGKSKIPAIAAAMARACKSDLWKAIAIVDLDTSSATSVDAVKTVKDANGFNDKDMVVCWPLVKVDGKIVNYSTVLTSKLAWLDHENDDVSSDSPSNKDIPISACVLADGSEVFLTMSEADTVSGAGVVTAINWTGWRAWGNYTAAAPEETDLAKKFICTNRMMQFLCNKFVKMYFDYVDRPISRVLIDAIVDDYNLYLNGLANAGAINSGEIAYVEANNSAADLIAGGFRLDCKTASPVPAQQINMVSEFSVEAFIRSFTKSEE